MITHAVPLVLTDEEERLVLALREVPEGRLRRSVGLLVDEILDFAAHPTCSEMQADGAPCESAESSCDDCRKVTRLVDVLRRRVQAGRA